MLQDRPFKFARVGAAVAWWVAAVGVGASLTGCGFKLRGEQTFAFETISVGAPQNGAVAAELRRALAKQLREPLPPGTPANTPASPAGQSGQVAPQVLMTVLNEQREKSVVGVNAAGQVREFQLRIRVTFRLRSAQGRDLIPDTEILQSRDISFNETAVLAKEAEEGLLYRDMQTDIVQQLLRRLAAVQAPL